MNPSPPNIYSYLEEGAGPGPASNTNATLAQAFNNFNPTALQQVVSNGVSVSDVHGLGASATPQHAEHVHDSVLGIGMQPPQTFPGLVATQMIQHFVEQRGLEKGNHERMDQWSGTIAWWGTDTTRNERREVRAQVTATASKGDPCAIFSL